MLFSPLFRLYRYYIIVIMAARKRKFLRQLSISILVILWFLNGWPVVWQNPRIPPKVKEAGAVGVMPTFQAKGTFTSGSGALSVPVPSGYQDNDVFLLFVESANEVIATPTGWTQLTNSPQYTGTAASAGGVRLAVFYKVVSGSQSNVSVADSGNHTTAIIANFRGVDTNGPIHITAGRVDSSATSSLSWATVTTTEGNALIINAVGLDKDGNDNNTLSSWTNGSLASPSVAEQHDQTVNTSVGGGLAFAIGGKVSAGSVNATTATGDSSTTHAYLTIALKSAPNNPPSLTVHQPDGVDDEVFVGQSYSITYDLSDAEDAATVDFYYDSDGSGSDGTAIAGCQDQAEGAGAICSWDTIGMTAGDYYIYGIAADGINPDVNDYSSGVITIQAAAVISIAITTDGTISYGILPVGAGKDTTASGLNDTQTAKNDGNTTEIFNIKTSNAAGGVEWAIGALPGADVFVHEFSTNSGSAWTKFSAADVYQTLATNIIPNGTQNVDFRITVPDASTDFQQKSITITIQAVQQ